LNQQMRTKLRSRVSELTIVLHKSAAALLIQ
jgi:hypothetical protein